MSGPTLPYHAHAPSADGNQSLFDLIEQLTERLNRQEPIELDAVLAGHPEHAEELRKIWPTLAILAELRSADGKSAPSFPPDSVSDGSSLTGTLGDFRILKEIGRGGMGVVYEAEQISLGRHVALKVLPFAGVLDERQLQRFKNEALAAAHLNHPHIVDVYGVGCERGVHFYTMRLIDGVSVQQLIEELRATLARRASEGSGASTPTPHAETPRLAALSTDPSRRREYYRNIAQLGIDAAEALHHAHEQGVIHRDIKPSNLMLDHRGKLWVTDFGLAQIETGATLTMSGELIGTLRYMSPEQASGQHLGLDHRCDVYSLGATLYELLTLGPAFTGENRAELLQQILFHDPKPLRKVRPEIPVDLETIIMKAMAKLPGERYATAQELAEDLRRIKSDQPILSRRVTAWGRVRRWARRNPIVATLLTLFVTTLIAGTTVSTILAARATQALNDVKDAEDDYRREHARAQENLYNAAETVQKLLTRVSQEQLFYTPGATELRRQLLIEAGGQLDALSEGQSDPELLELTASAHRDIGGIHHHCGDFEESLASFDRALSLQQSTASVDNNLDDQVLIAIYRSSNANNFWFLGRNVEAESELTLAIEAMTDVCSRLPNERAHHEMLEELHRSRGLVRFSAGNIVDAETEFRTALSMAERLTMLRDQDDWKIPLDQLRMARNLVYLSTVGRTQGDVASGRAAIEDAALLFDEIEEAIADFSQSQLMEIGTSFPLPFHFQIAWVKSEMLIERGQVMLELEDSSAALLNFREAVTILEPVARDYPDIYWSCPQLATAYCWLSGLVEDAEAQQCVSAARELIESVDNVSLKGVICNHLAWNCVSEIGPRNTHPDVVSLAQAGVQYLPNFATWNTLGVALFRNGRYEEAIDALMESDALEVEKTGYNGLFLAMSYWQLGDTETATGWYQRAIEAMDSHKSNSAELLRFRAEADALLGVAAEPAM